MKRTILTLWAAVLALVAVAVAPAHADQRAMIGFGGSGNISTLGTFFVPVNGAIATTITNETIACTPWRGAGTISKLRLRANANGRTAATDVYIRVNGARSALGTAYTGTALYSDDDDVTVAAGDTVCLEITLGSGSGAIAFKPITFEFRTATDQVFTHLSSGGANVTSATAGGISFAGTAQAFSTGQADFVALESVTLSNLVVGGANAGTAGSTWTTRKNSAVGSQAVTLSASATDFRAEDTINSDSYSAGEPMGIAKPALTSATINRAGFKYRGNVAGRTMICVCGGNAVSAAATAYGSIAGGPNYGSSEAITQATVPFAMTVSKLSARVYTYSGTTPVTITLRKNGADTLCVVTVSAAGTQTDNTNSCTFAAGDTINTKVVGGDATANFAGIYWLQTDDNATGGGGGGPSTPANDNGLLLRGVGANDNHPLTLEKAG